MFKLVFLLLAVAVFACAAHEAFLGSHGDSISWTKDVTKVIKKDQKVAFTVALKLQNEELMHDEFISLSSPKSPKYGKYYSHEEIQSKFGPSRKDRLKVAAFFMQIEGAEVEGIDGIGDFLTVSAPAHAIEKHLKTSLSYRKSRQGLVDRAAIRADTALDIPRDVADKVNFISLNSPVAHMTPRAGKSLKSKQEEDAKKKVEASGSASSVGMSSGQHEVLLTFQAVCGDGSLNRANPPCSNLANTGDWPNFQVTMNQYAMNATSSPSPTTLKPLYTTMSLTTDPTRYYVPNANVYCGSSIAPFLACDGTTLATNCTCAVKIAPVPMYVHIDFEIQYNTPSNQTHVTLGTTTQQTNTDVATAQVLSNLYSIPNGIKVRYGSNQSVVEFYGEFYSNSDLLTFFQLSGLPSATIPNVNVLGDLPNDQNNPGGEAQLDVEYIMALAPGAETYFYSFSDLNPYNYDDGNGDNDSNVNEGFLAYLTYVSEEAYPPLVHSLSYGDVEADIFNVSHVNASDIATPNAAAYGAACDQQFMKMGMRGLSVLFSSGDDGVGNSIVRTDPELGCSQAFPAWPASSPYVTAVGGTQLSNQYTPLCGQNYATSATFSNMPAADRLTAQCTGVKETTCSSTIGGVITSGGGFSSYSSRKLTPWQEDVVTTYLNISGATPEASYFNSTGRAYPDVATYASNYFVYLDGKLSRESGTSASAPVFAAMVTLWNDMRLAYGMAPMGFIAPFLYDIYADHPEAFNDITTGDNACSAGRDITQINCCSQSFKAAPGWDAVTGLGSPNFQIISNLVLNMSTPFPASSASSGLNTFVTESSTSSSAAADDDDFQDVKASSDGALAVAIISLIVSIGSSVYFYFKNKESMKTGTQSLL